MFKMPFKNHPRMRTSMIKTKKVQNRGESLSDFSFSLKLKLYVVETTSKMGLKQLYRA